MELFSESKTSRLTVEVADRELIMYPSLNLFVSVSDDGFCEARSYVWVTVQDYTNFILALRWCEPTRRGRAVLSSMGPHELEIVIENSDNLGHFYLQYRLGRTSFTKGSNQDKIVSGSFGLGSDFAQFVADFAELLPAD